MKLLLLPGLLCLSLSALYPIPSLDTLTEEYSSDMTGMQDTTRQKDKSHKNTRSGMGDTLHKTGRDTTHDIRRTQDTLRHQQDRHQDTLMHRR